MTRRDEVEAKIEAYKHGTRFITADERNELARTLADEVDAERAVVTKLLAMLKPGECKDWLGGYWLQQHTFYERACEIAGRTE